MSSEPRKTEPTMWRSVAQYERIRGVNVTAASLDSIRGYVGEMNERKGKGSMGVMSVLEQLERAHD